MSSSTINIQTDVADILRRSTIRDKLLVLPPGQLSRTLYESVNKVLATLGGKWNRKSKGHVFDRDPAEALARALGAGSVLDTKRAYEQFYTPVHIAERMAEYAVTKGDHVLEPSAGTGRLVEAALKAGAGGGHGSVTAVEIDPRNVAELRQFGIAVCTVEADFLEWAKGARADFDAVLMNPPFSTNQDVRHVRAAWDLLKVAGRMAAIISPHASFANDRASREFRQWIDDIGLDVDEELPPGTFAEAGTMVRTRLICATKR